ncbi:hypothetical protein [Bacillus sp. FJAT-27245]|uniref:hypothetical protein n=1 Tax=Bacillus sp. FJAT-27245 TaxID=1684144 RepID=UPI0006A75FFF|nr:hypothetical protein [Bacillus sp. FJAT-27245]
MFKIRFSLIMVFLLLVSCDKNSLTHVIQKEESDLKLGFTSTEIKTIKNNLDKPIEIEVLNPYSKNKNLKNRELLQFIELGLNKTIIQHLTEKEYEFFSQKKVEPVETITQYYKIIEKEDGNWALYSGTKEEFQKENNFYAKNGFIDENCSPKELICVNSTINQKNNGTPWLYLTTSVAKLLDSNTYAVISSFQWLVEPDERFKDYLGLTLSSDKAVIDYDSIFGKYERVEYKNKKYQGSFMDWINQAHQSSSFGYSIPINIGNDYHHTNNRSYLDFGYSYAEVYFNSKEHSFFDVNTSYVHTLKDPKDVGVIIKNETIKLGSDLLPQLISSPSTMRIYEKVPPVR